MCVPLKQVLINTGKINRQPLKHLHKDWHNKTGTQFPLPVGRTYRLGRVWVEKLRDSLTGGIEVVINNVIPPPGGEVCIA